MTFGGNIPYMRKNRNILRVLAKYVRDEGVLSLEQATYKMTALPARRIHLSARGVKSAPELKQDEPGFFSRIRALVYAQWKAASHRDIHRFYPVPQWVYL